MDSLLLSRLSDYFSCWKLKVLLQKGQGSSFVLDQSLLDGSKMECSLDYSVWRKHLHESELAGQQDGGAQGKNYLMNTVKVRRVSVKG